MLARNIARNRLHRTRTVQRHNCGNIFNGMRLESGHNIGNTRTFKLKHTGGFALCQHRIRRIVIQRNIVQMKIRMLALHHFFRIGKHGEISQTQKVHLEQTQFFQRRHDELRDHIAVIGGERYIMVDRFIGDDNTGRVRGRMARHSLQTARRVDELMNGFIALIHLPQLLRRRECLINGNMQLGRNQFCHHIDVTIRNIERASDISNRVTRRHRAERHNLCDMIRAILARHVINHFLPAFIAKIHVDIRHADAFRIQKAFEIQRILNRVKRGNIQTVGDHRACRRASARTDRNAMRFGIVNKIPYNQEIIDKAHALNHIQFILQTLALFRVIRIIAAVKAFHAQLVQIFLRGVSVRHIK